MRRRSRIRRFLKWTGLTACVLIVAAWGVSAFRDMDYRIGPDLCRVGYGAVGVYYDDSPDRYLEEGLPWTEWSVVRTRNVTLFRRPRAHLAGSTLVMIVPFWALFLCVAIPTAWTWERDRRPPKGHCQQCGYDLTGNVSGVCPECSHSESVKSVTERSERHKRRTEIDEDAPV
jgi:hypothetical protein